MTGAIQRPQRSTRTACSTSPSKPRALTSCFRGDSEREKTAASTEEVDGEERRRDAPVDDARQRFVEEQPDAAAARPEVDGAELVEQRVDGEGLDAPPRVDVAEVGVGPELGRHDGDLVRLEIPADGARHDAAQQGRERVSLPVRHDAAGAAQQARRVGGEVDAGGGRGADQQARGESG